MNKLIWQRKILKLGNSVALTIPEEIADALKLIPQDKVLITLEGNKVVFQK